MSCQKFDEETLKMYVQGKLEKYSRIVLAIKVHLTKCTRCRKRVAELKKKEKSEKILQATVETANELRAQAAKEKEAQEEEKGGNYVS